MSIMKKAADKIMMHDVYDLLDENEFKEELERIRQIIAETMAELLTLYDS